MLSEELSPQKWAFQISHVLNTVLGTEHFPIDIKKVAREYSLQICPDEPITKVAGESLPGFEGGLFKAPTEEKGWGIFYNKDISSLGRINYTLAHEFGHYLLHRLKYPDGLRCGEQDFYRWESEYKEIEKEANIFAANLLMPLDDYRRQIGDGLKINLDMIGLVAERYGVSLLAALLRWIQYTAQRAVLVVSRDGFILWARSSKPAFKSGAFIRTANVPPVAIPELSMAAGKGVISTEEARSGKKLSSGIWFNEPCEEHTIYSDQYDFVISVVQLPKIAESSYEEIRIKQRT